MVCVSFCVTAFCCLHIVDIWTIVLKVLKDKKKHNRKLYLPGKNEAGSERLKPTITSCMTKITPVSEPLHQSTPRTPFITSECLSLEFTTQST